MSNSYNALVSTLTAHKGAGTADINACLNPRSVHHFSEQTMTYGETLGVDFELGFSLPQKQVKRLTQFINVLQTGIVGSFDKTHARLLISMRAAGQYNLTTDALHALTAGARSDKVNTRGVTVGTVNTLFKGAHGLSTVGTKVSNSTGKNGFMQQQGMTFAPPTQNHEVMLNLDHPAVTRFFSIIDNASAGQLAQLSE